MNPPARLDIQLLGDFSIVYGGKPLLTVDTLRLRSLLSYLALKRGKPQARSKLAFLFWPDSTEKQALTNLRHQLHQLRRALPAADSFLEANGKTICWKEDAPSGLDVDAFNWAVSGGKLADSHARRDEACVCFKKAAELYQGDLLPGHYDDWMNELRERLALSHAEALSRLIACCEADRAYAEAARYCRRLLRFDVTRESTYATLMRLYSMNGDRASALEAYEECVSVLKREIGAEPGRQLSDLHERLQNTRLASTSSSIELRDPAGPELALHGRREEWLRLQNAWGGASRGEAKMVTIIGEAGIGKSRLAEELYVTLGRQGIDVVGTRSYAAEGRLAYAPICQWLRAPILQQGVATLDAAWRLEVSRIMPELKTEFVQNADLPIEGRSWRRRNLFEALSRAIAAHEKPLMLLLDDMQWTDQESLEWLRFHLRFARHAKLLVLGTIREEELTLDRGLRALLLDLRRDEQLEEIRLGPLSAEEAALVAGDVAGHALSAQEVDRLHQEAEGNPLFVVECVRAGVRLKTGSSFDSLEGLVQTGALSPMAYAVFAARLAQLSKRARELVGVAAVLGRSFNLEMLARTSGDSEELVTDLLEELWERRIIKEHEAGVYDFSHDKLREVSYQEISTPRRRLLHRKASDALEATLPEARDAVMAMLASHYEQAGQVSKAVKAYRDAAVVARRSHAGLEAIRLFKKATALLISLPSTADRLKLELELNTELGVCIVNEFGYCAPEVDTIYGRARDLCVQLNRPTSAPTLRAMALFSLSTGRLHQSFALGRELARLEADQRDAILYCESRYVLGVSTFWLGEFKRSSDYLQAAIDHYEPKNAATHIDHYAQDPLAICLCRLAWNQLYLGEIDQALRNVNQATEYARQLDHPYTLGYVLYFGSQVYAEAGEFEKVAENLAIVGNMSDKRQVEFWKCRCDLLLAYIDVVQLGHVRSIAKMEDAISRFLRLNNLNAFSQHTAELAEAHLVADQPLEGLQVLQAARTTLVALDETYYNAELLRIEGELLRTAGGDSGRIETLFLKSQALAREQENALFQLRSATSLGRLLRSQSRTDEAKKQVRGACERFVAGSNLKEFVEARRLLETW